MTLTLPLVAHGEQGAQLTTGQDGAIVRRSILPGGVRVLTEHMPGQRSATVGAWVGVGSRDETDGHFGSTHFLEHLLFKGTRKRSAMDIATAFDSVGGESNAATGKEHTCYYARVLDTDVPMAVDVITDMITSATLEPQEFETERGVILEELSMNEDDPSDVVHEQFAATVLGDNPLGRPIGGTAQTIKAVPRDAVWEHYLQHYCPQSLVVTAAGGVDHDALCDLVQQGLLAGGWELADHVVPRPRRSSQTQLDGIPTVGQRRDIFRPVEQANIVVGSTGIAATDDRRFTMNVLTALFGGGMSSRLFQEVREKRGMAYSTYCFYQGHGGVGTFGMYAGCAPANADTVESLLNSELDKLAHDGITEQEHSRTIGQLSGGLVLGLEDSGSRMSRLGRFELVFGQYMSLDEALDRIHAVTRDDVQALAADLASRARSTVRVGPFGGDSSKS